MERENNLITEKEEANPKEQLRARLNPAIFILKGLMERKNVRTRQ